jgi:trimeric autotransporter adhesin
MRKNLLIAILAITGIFVCYQLFYSPVEKKIQEDNVIPISESEIGKKKQDGIAETQKMEFELTRDVKLGYIPKNRLIRAAEDLKTARLKGTYANRTNALSWAERGPNTDVIGPSNGNTRGTQPAADGVTSGRMRTICVDLADVTNHTVWAGGVSGGLWKTNDITSTASAAWSLVNDFFGNLAIASICQDPTNTDIMYFGTGEKTFNVDAVRGGGIWKSIDHGVTWNLLANTTGFFNVSKILCDAAGNVYVAIMSGGVQRSTNGGTSWTSITPTGLTPYVTEMKLSNTGRLHIVCGYRLTGGTSGYRYTDAPATVGAGAWTLPATTFPTDYNCELAVAGNTLYAQPADVNYLIPVIYKSTNGGANWAPTLTSPPGGTVEPSILPGAQGWYDLAIGVDPVDPNIVIAGGLNFYRSIDGGANWTQLTRWVGTALNYVHADHHTVVWNGTQVLLGSDGGLFYSNDNGLTFTDRNDGLRLKQFYSCAIHPTTTNYFIAGAQDNGTHQLTNAGLGGSTEVIGGDGAYTHIDQDEPQYQFSAFVRNDFIRSTNGGASWGRVTFSTTLGQFINPSDYDDIGNKMYASTAAGQYLRWENPQTGNSFSSIPIAAFGGSTARSITVSPHTANRVFFGTAGSRVVKVDNAHLTTPGATDISGSGMSAGSVVSCVAVGTNDNNLIATFSNYGAIHVWVSTTGGGASGWTNISGNLPDIPVRWAMFYPEDNTKAIIATEMGVYETDLINGAATVWVQNSSFPVVKTNMLQYRKSDGTVLAATHGRGLWTASIPFTNPYVRFATNFNNQTEVTIATTATCRNYRDYVVNMNIDQAPTGNANITLNVAGGSTATQALDFDFTTNGDFVTPSNVLTFASGSSTPQPITIRVYNDAELEGEEFVTLNYTVGGGTNALAAPSSPAYTFTIPDNDISPITEFSGSNYAAGVFNTNITGQSPFQSNLQKFRIQTLYTATELKAAGIAGTASITAMNMRVVTKNSTQPYTGFTISMANTTATAFSNFLAPAFTQVYSGSYSSVVGDNNFIFTTPFVWNGTSNVVVQFCYDNSTPADALADIMEGTVTPLGTGVRASVYSNATTGVGCTLGAAFISDSRIRAVFTAAGPGTLIETVLNNNTNEYVANNSLFYFYNASNVLNSITNSSANLGCVTSNIFEAGNTWQTFSGGNRSQKVIEITPTTNPGASYTVGLYLTAAEMGGRDPNILPIKIAKTTAATMAGANSGNTVIASATSFSAFGTGYLFTATFTGFSKFFLVDNNVTLPVSLLTFDGRQVNNTNVLDWSTSAEQNSKEFEIEKSSDGTNFYSIGIVPAAGNSSSVRNYSFTDKQVNEFNYYRLKMIDIDRRSVFSRTILLKNPNAEQNVRVVENPFRSNITVRFAKTPQQRVRFELVNVSGAVVYRKEYGSAGQVTIDLSGMSLSSGTYILKTSVDGKLFTNKLVKQ